jgi:shikimate kinase
MLKSRNIFLIGMMGSWKSTRGHPLSQQLGMKFIDMDDEIEERTGKAISAIFDMNGESYFRELETQLLTELALESGKVISTGGGVVISPVNRKILQSSSGLNIFLFAEIPVLVQRIRNTNKRPLLSYSLDKLNDLEEIWETRKKWYEACATITIDTSQIEPLQVLAGLTVKLEAIHANN